MDKQLILNRAKSILLAESEAIRNIPLNEDLLKALKIIASTQGKVICSGMGKAGIIARKVAATFSSTGTPAVFLHPGEAQHGDLGVITSTDTLLIFSNSGKTREALELAQLSKILYPEHLRIITVTSDTTSNLALLSDVALSIGKVEEACSLGMAPTTSTTAMLALGDVLCMMVMEQIEFTREEFLKRHHGGYLGSHKHQ